MLVTRFSDRSSVRPIETGDMLLGMSLDQVTACVTINAATIWSAVYDPGCVKTHTEKKCRK